MEIGQLSPVPNILKYSTPTWDLEWANTLHDDIASGVWHSVKKPGFFTVQIFSPVMEKGIFHNLNWKIVKTDNEINLLSVLNYKEQTSKYQYTIHICWLNVNFWLILIVFM